MFSFTIVLRKVMRLFFGFREGTKRKIIGFIRFTAELNFLRSVYPIKTRIRVQAKSNCFKKPHFISGKWGFKDLLNIE